MCVYAYQQMQFRLLLHACLRKSAHITAANSSVCSEVGSLDTNFSNSTQIYVTADHYLKVGLQYVCWTRFTVVVMDQAAPSAYLVKCLRI